MPRRPTINRAQRIDVAIGLIECHGRYLICRRPRGTIWGGYWEFPGGKQQRGESPTACLSRELWEELSLRPRTLRWRCTIRYAYVYGTVVLSVFRCDVAHDGFHRYPATHVRWVLPARLTRYRFPPANKELLQKLIAESTICHRHSCTGVRVNKWSVRCT